MPTKRQVLDLLNRKELVVGADQFEIPVDDRRSKDKLLTALAASRKANLEELLSKLSRDRLKELCSGLGLDESGREKALLVERLTGRAITAKDEAESDNVQVVRRRLSSLNRGLKSLKHPLPSDEVALPASGKLTTEALERYLWSAADILRGSIDSSDYKGFILGLLFLKRLSDRFEEECQAIIADGGDPEDEDEHQFYVPKRARWSEIQKVATNIGEALNKACSALEDSNSKTLEGVLAGIDFNDERKLGDAKSRDTVLARLVQHFSALNLRNANLSEPDMLGRAYEYLIEQFADDAGKKGGEFYTPRKVVKLMVEILAPKEGMRICDPTCGSGGMLIECANFVERHEGNRKNLSLFGQEKNLGTWAIAKMNMLLHGLPDARIEKGDTIRDPKLLQDGSLMLFDRVIANPPFSLDHWGHDIAVRDPFGRFPFGVPAKSKGDYAFVEHMLATLNASGLAAVVMPPGVLFRENERPIRRGIVESDVLEVVIGLAENLFYGTGIAGAILVFNRNKDKARRGKVLFIDGSAEYESRRVQNTLSDHNVKTLAEAAARFRDVPGLARIVSAEEIASNGYNLNLIRYVTEPDAASAVSLPEELKRLELLKDKQSELDRRFDHIRGTLGI